MAGAAIFTPSPASSPWILRYPHLGFSRASRRTRAWMSRRVAGRPVLPLRDRAAQRRRTMSRCQRRIVPGVTASRSPWRRALGITPTRVANSARSAQSAVGRRGCRRCRTASWWRRIKISAIFCASSRRDGRSHAASRIIRRNTNRRHMIGDHHGRSAGRATLLVRAADGILGTHRSARPPRASPAPSATRRGSGCRSRPGAERCSATRPEPARPPAQQGRQHGQHPRPRRVVPAGFCNRLQRCLPMTERS